MPLLNDRGQIAHPTGVDTGPLGVFYTGPNAAAFYHFLDNRPSQSMRMSQDRRDTALAEIHDWNRQAHTGNEYSVDDLNALWNPGYNYDIEGGPDRLPGYASHPIQRGPAQPQSMVPRPPPMEGYFTHPLPIAPYGAGGLGSLGGAESPYGHEGVYGRDITGIPTLGQEGSGFFSYGPESGAAAEGGAPPMSFAYGGVVPDQMMGDPGEGPPVPGGPDMESLENVLGGDRELMEVMSDPLLDDVVMAIQNPGMPGSEEAIQAFVDRFGEETLRLLEQAITSGGGEEAMPSPTDVISELSQLAASQGQAPGDGLSDSIPGSIDGTEPVSLSSGEYVLPADVVAHAGNGDTNAGVRSIEGGIAALRDARTGNSEAPNRVDPMGLFG